MIKNTLATEEFVEETRTPLGTISYFSGPIPPEGWLLCNGSRISRAVYAELFSIIGVTYGIGDGSSTFNLPDFRGYFLRGLDSGRNLDPLRLPGSIQSDAIRNMTGSVTNITTTGLTSSGAFTSYNISADTVSGSGTGWYKQRFQFNASMTVPVASENRPVNHALNIIIKY